MDGKQGGARRGSPEQRFMERMAFCGPGLLSAQEVSMPRKARSLDLVMLFDVAPVWFGALRKACSDRVVLFEHLSRRARLDDVASARVGEAWLAWERLRPAGRRGEPPSPWSGERAGARAPLAVVVADGVQGSLHGAVPLLRRQDAAGVWATPSVREGGIIVLDTTLVQAEEGYAWWSWIGRARSDAEAAERLSRLLGEPRIPTTERARLKEAIMDGELETSATERESVYQRLQREIREGKEEGIRQGLRWGREKGREALLRIIASVAPDELPSLRSIEDLDALERAVTERLLRGHRER